MIDWKDCIVPIGKKDPEALPKRAKRQPMKCSTCANLKCRIRGVVCDWTHCFEWEAKSFEG